MVGKKGLDLDSFWGVFTKETQSLGASTSKCNYLYLDIDWFFVQAFFAGLLTALFPRNGRSPATMSGWFLVHYLNSDHRNPCSSKLKSHCVLRCWCRKWQVERCQLAQLARRCRWDTGWPSWSSSPRWWQCCRQLRSRQKRSQLMARLSQRIESLVWSENSKSITSSILDCVRVKE